MHPIGLDQIMKVANAGRNMPPKSTWFEPKPKSGFVVRVFEDWGGGLRERGGGNDWSPPLVLMNITDRRLPSSILIICKIQ